MIKFDRENILFEHFSSEALRNSVKNLLDLHDTHVDILVYLYAELAFGQKKKSSSSECLMFENVNPYDICTYAINNVNYMYFEFESLVADYYDLLSAIYFILLSYRDDRDEDWFGTIKFKDIREYHALVGSLGVVRNQVKEWIGRKRR